MIWRLSGVVGIDPLPFTLRELWDMAYGAWQPTTHIVATLANANRDPKKHPRPIQPKDCHPLEQRGGGRGVKLTSGNLRNFKALFTRKDG